ncbi:uncharacterized protein [Maniola hyperantus]|uniref:uncharacterized protein n=1 Tax=Aphantopus hyperantus TaxID=2795564 RepID=UPI003749D13B
MMFSLPFQIMASTTMGELCLRPPPPGQEEFFSRIYQIIEDNYPDDWKSWEVQDLPYSDLFGERISSRIEAKLRFAIPTAEMATAYCPNDASLSEKKYRLIKRQLLEWPFGRALLYSPHSIMEKIHTKSYEDFINTVKLLKPRLTSRDEASTSESTPRKRRSTSPISSRNNKTPRHEPLEPNRAPVTDAFMIKMMDLLTKQTQAIESVANQVSTLAPKSDQGSSELDESFESVPDSTEPEEEFRGPALSALPQENTSSLSIPTNGDAEEAALIAQITEAQRKLATIKTTGNIPKCDFSPCTTEAEPKLTKADPNLVDQGRKCQRLNEDGWKNIRYADVQKTFHATPVFSALKVNNHLATITPNWNSTAQLEKTDMTLGAITYGLLLQRKAFQEACQKMDPNTRREIQNHMLGADSCFKKISDGLLQYSCGRRAEIIQARRETYKPANKVLGNILHDIPPSDTHLFSEEKLSEVIKDQGGAHKIFPKKTSPNKTGKKNPTLKGSKNYKEHSHKNKKQRNFRDFRAKQDSGTSGTNKARTTQTTKKKP